MRFKEDPNGDWESVGGRCAMCNYGLITKEDMHVIRKRKHDPMPELKPGMRVHANTKQGTFRYYQDPGTCVIWTAIDGKLFDGRMLGYQITRIFDLDGTLIWSKDDE